MLKFLEWSAPLKRIVEIAKAKGGYAHKLKSDERVRSEHVEIGAIMGACAIVAFHEGLDDDADEYAEFSCLCTKIANQYDVRIS